MTAFTNEEMEYMAEQRLGRLATVDPAGRPHVVPVTFRYNPELGTIDIGGHDFAKRKKWRDGRRVSRPSSSTMCARRGGRASSRCVAGRRRCPTEGKRSWPTSRPS